MKLLDNIMLACQPEGGLPQWDTMKAKLMNTLLPKACEK